MRSVELKTREIQCVVGDNSEQDEHRAGYNGAWSLTSVHEPVNLYVPAYGGLNLEHIFDGSSIHGEHQRYFEPRNHPMELERDGEGVVLYQSPTPYTGVESWTTFRVEEPNRVRFRFRARPSKVDFKFGYVGFFWASYINCPENKSIYFGTPAENEKGWRWYQHCTLAHGRDSTVRSAEDAVDTPIDGDDHRYLYSAFSPVRYARPFYYGVRGKMVLIYVFEENDGIVRFSHSPSGGGRTPDDMDTRPAWDFLQILPNPEAGRRYEMKLTAIYKPYEGRTDVIRQVDAVLGK